MDTRPAPDSNLAPPGLVRTSIDQLLYEVAQLVARLATLGHARTLLADLPDRLFYHLACALEAQGLSKKIVADMCGLALRSYQKRLQRVAESRSDAGRTLWEAVFAFLYERGITKRSEVERRFARDDEQLLGSVLHDLVESGLVFKSGSGANSVYRAAREGELDPPEHGHDEGTEALVWLSIYRLGPLSFDALLARHRSLDEAHLELILERLLADGRVTAVPGERVYRCRQIVLPADARSPAAAAIIDHVHAVFTTLGTALSLPPGDPLKTWTGGSTYTFELDLDTPLGDEAKGLLPRLRAELTALRQAAEAQRIEPGTAASTHPDGAEHPTEPPRILVYCGVTALTPRPGDSSR